MFHALPDHTRAWTLISVLLVTGGCAKQPEPWQPEPNGAPLTELIPFESLSDGPRPASFSGATFVNTHLFHEEGAKDGDRICIEGTVNATGVAMGAPYISLACIECGGNVHCEGYELDKYSIAKGARVVLRGRVFHGKMLAEAQLVSKEQLEDALAEVPRGN